MLSPFHEFSIYFFADEWFFAERTVDNYFASYVLTEPRKPGSPTNLTEGDTLIMVGKVAVSLRWLPPKKSDLPISRYKVSLVGLT
jgi:hypothetical protein